MLLKIAGDLRKIKNKRTKTSCIARNFYLLCHHHEGEVMHICKLLAIRPVNLCKSSDKRNKNNYKRQQTIKLKLMLNKVDIKKRKAFPLIVNLQSICGKE